MHKNKKVVIPSLHKKEKLIDLKSLTEHANLISIRKNNPVNTKKSDVWSISGRFKSRSP